MANPVNKPILTPTLYRHLNDQTNDIESIARQLNNLSITLVTSIPSSANDGQQILYRPVEGISWRFIYNASSASTYKWEFIGGPPMVSEVLTSETRAVTSYGDLTTVGPSITIPIAGDFDIEVQADIANDTVNDGGRMSFAVGGTAAIDDDGATHQSSTANAITSVIRLRRKTAISASTAITAKYEALVGGTATFRRRIMRITPVRVG